MIHKWTRLLLLHLSSLSEFLVFQIARFDEFEHGVPKQKRVLPVVESLTVADRQFRVPG
jgi:hypothetical protein